MRKILTVAFSLFVVYSYAQDYIDMFNPIFTSVTSLEIYTDARMVGLGGNGVATTGDNASQHSNPAKYAFCGDKASIGISGTQWLPKLADDMNKFTATGFFNIRGNCFSISANHFSLGEVYTSSDVFGFNDKTIKPDETTIDIAYSRKINKEIALSAGLRYINSDLTYSYDEDSKAGNAIAFDFSFYWQHPIFTKSSLNVGAALRNIGSKIKFGGSNNSEFIPSKLSVGAGLNLDFHRFHQLGIYFQADKLLVPTYPQRKHDETRSDWATNDYDEPSSEYEERVQKDYYEVSSIGGIFKSFGDAPGGFKEELEEINLSFGVEYTLFNLVSIREGIHYESKNKGGRSYYSPGLGFKSKFVDVNVAYVVGLNKNSPIDQIILGGVVFNIP